MAYSLIGKNFTPPDIHGKVTGKAKYAEDFKVDGMLYARLLTSPMPHARIRRLDVSEALKIEGVVAVLTADDVPNLPGLQNPILTNEPAYVGTSSAGNTYTGSTHWGIEGAFYYVRLRADF